VKGIEGKFLRTILRVFALLSAISVAGVAFDSRALAGPALLGEEPIVIKPTAREPATIAIPTFDVVAAAGQERFNEIVYNDLAMTGYFQRCSNQGFVEETHQSDAKRGNVDFAEWKRLGAMFLLKGSCQVSDDKLVATCYLYYVPTGKRILGEQFFSTADKPRVLAHYISDRIFWYVTGNDGVANTKILYVSLTDTARRNSEVWCMDADGAGAFQVTNENSLVATPCWGSNGTEVYYTSWKNYNPDLYGIYLKGGSAWTISYSAGLNVSPAWSQARKKIAMTLSKDGNSEIYTVDRDGKNLKRVTFDRPIDASPSWSPSGDDIAFTSDQAGTGSPQVYMMDADGGSKRRISFVGSTYCDSAAWSPKGDKIAFVARQNGRFDIYVAEIDGSNPKRLTSGEGNNEDPSWSPNGLMLAFASDRSGSSQIYVVNSDGSNVRQITRRGQNTAPAWSPFLYGTPKR